LDINAEANRKPKGKRPWFYQSQEAERVLNITLALAQELAVTRERMDTLERILAAKGVLALGEFDAYQPSKEVAETRSAATQAYLARILRVISQEIEAIAQPEADSVSVEELARE
jgi:hypothetical protein